MTTPERAESVGDVADRIEGYMEHDTGCVRGRFEAGEPTPDGGYRQMYAGKWYSDPALVPPCECGRDEAIRALHTLARAQTPEREEFVEAAMEWGANSVKWDQADEPDQRRALRAEATDICGRMDKAYRAMLAREAGR